MVPTGGNSMNFLKGNCMNRSEQINELATALSKAQGEMKGAIKDAANPFFKSKYADLASVVEAIRQPFAKNGLSYVQNTEPSESEEVRVETVLMHASGQWMASTIALPVAKADAQGFGSAITYARRYGLSAMAGVAPEDDDGNAAAHAKPDTKAMPESNLTDHLSAIEGAASVAELQKVFGAAYKAAQTFSDRRAMESLTKAKDNRKVALQEPQT